MEEFIAELRTQFSVLIFFVKPYNCKISSSGVCMELDPVFF